MLKLKLPVYFFAPNYYNLKMLLHTSGLALKSLPHKLSIFFSINFVIFSTCKHLSSKSCSSVFSMLWFNFALFQLKEAGRGRQERKKCIGWVRIFQFGRISDSTQTPWLTRFLVLGKSCVKQVNSKKWRENCISEGLSVS